MTNGYTLSFLPLSLLLGLHSFLQAGETDKSRTKSSRIQGRYRRNDSHTCILSNVYNPQTHEQAVKLGSTQVLLRPHDSPDWLDQGSC